MKTMLFFSSIILLAVFHEGKIVQAESMNESDASGSGSDDGNNTSYIIPFSSTSTLVAITSIELSTAILSPSPPPSPPTSTFTANSISFPTTSLPTAGTTTAIIEATSITTLALTAVPTASTTITSSPVSSDATTSSLFMPDTMTTLFVATTSASSMTATSSAVAVFSVLSSSMPTASNLQFTTTVQPSESVAMSSATVIPMIMSSSTVIPLTMSSSTVVPIVSTSVTTFIMLTPTLSFSSSVSVVASSSIPSIQSLSVSQSPSPSVAPPLPAGPLPIIAGAASGVCVIIVCTVFICIVCCCLRKRGKFELKTSGKDGTTLAREYQLQPFHGVSAVAKQKEDEATISTGTFGIQSPTLVEVDVGGQKFTFPDLPANGESLPALIIVNPVKHEEIFSNTYASRSSTLPSRKKNKVLANSDSVDITDSSLFGIQMKTSRSVSELNKDARPALPTHIGLSSDQNASSMQSPIYDTPRTFKPLKSSEETENKSADASSNATDYVTMEPPSMTASQQPAPVEVNQQSVPVETKKSAIVDRLAPKQSEAETESIYDNARLIKSNPLVTEKIFPVQTNSAATSSIYDVPRKLLVRAESSTTSTKTPVPVPSTIVAKTLSGGDLESVYDVPKINVKKETTKTSDISNTQPLYCNVVRKSEDVPQLFSKQNQTANESDKLKINSTVAAKDDSKAAKISIDEENSQADGTKNPLLLPKSNSAVVTTPDTSKDNTQADSSSNKPVILPKPSAVKNPVAVVSDTPKSEVQADGSNKPVLLPKPKNSFAMVSDTPKSETEAESSINTKPVIQPKPKKSSTTDTPTVPPPKSTKPRVLSRKSDQEKSASPQCESSDESRRETETSSDNGTPEPMASGEEGQNAPTPKPRTKPRKGTKRQVGLPQNLMQELFARQSSQSKLAETNALPTKPLVKPKPNMK